MNDRTRAERLEHATEQIMRLGMFLAGGVSKIRLWSEGQPGAHWERSSPRTVLYCDEHERDQNDCVKLDLTCTGYPIASASDPTGEAAIRKDRAAADLRRLDQLITWLNHNSDEAIDILERYATRDPTDKDTRESGAGELGCASCRRIRGPGGTREWWNPPCTIEATNVGGALEGHHLLCRACRDFVRTELHYTGQGRLPTNPELEHRRDLGRWPKRHEKAAS